MVDKKKMGRKIKKLWGHSVGTKNYRDKIGGGDKKIKEKRNWE